MKALIVGYGSIGKRHGDVLGGLYPQARIDVVSRHAEQSGGVFRSLDSVVGLDSYDYYVICSETFQHREQLAFLEERVSGKKILVEKPLFAFAGESPPPARNQVFVGYNLRFNPIIGKVRQALLGRRILAAQVRAGQYLPSWRPGRDYRGSYSASAARGGGVLLDLSHEIDYSAWLFGRLSKLHAISRKVSALEIDSDDIMQLVGITERGVVLSLGMDYLSHVPTRSMIVQCEGATLVADMGAARFELAESGGEPVVVEQVASDRNASYAAMHRDILENGARDACTLAEAWSVLKTIEKIRDSERMDWFND